MKVHLYKTTNDGQQQLIVSAWLSDGGQIMFSGDEDVIARLRTEGIRNYQDLTKPLLFVSDGPLFLEQLPYNFRSGYLMAELIED